MCPWPFGLALARGGAPDHLLVSSTRLPGCRHEDAIDRCPHEEGHQEIDHNEEAGEKDGKETGGSGDAAVISKKASRGAKYNISTNHTAIIGTRSSGGAGDGHDGVAEEAGGEHEATSPYRVPATEKALRRIALPVGAALQRDVQDLVLLEL